MRTRLVICLSAAAVLAASLPAHASAEGIEYRTSVKATLSYTERQDWQIVKPRPGGCRAVGSGFEVLHAQSSGRTLLHEFKEDSHRPFTASVAPTVRWTDQVVDNTTLTPPESEDTSCGDNTKDCGTFPLKSNHFSVVSRNDHVSLSDNRAEGQPSLDNCFSLGWQQPWYAHKVSGRWASKRWAAGRAGVHHVTITKRFRPEIRRDTDVGDVQVTATVTFDLTYKMPAKRGRAI
jgi:hypothetical protein